MATQFDFTTMDPATLQQILGQQQQAADIQRASLSPAQSMQLRAIRGGRALGEMLSGQGPQEDPRVTKARNYEAAIQELAPLANDPEKFLEALGGKLASMGMGEEAQKVQTRLLTLRQSREKNAADLAEVQARTAGAKRQADPLQTLINSGRFTEESVAAYLKSGQPTDLKRRAAGKEVSKQLPNGKTVLGWEDDEGKFTAYGAQGEGVKVDVSMGDKKDAKLAGELRAQFNKEVGPVTEELQAYTQLQEALSLAATNPAAAAVSSNILVRAFRTDGNIGVAERAQLMNQAGLPQRVIDGLSRYFGGTLTPQRIGQIVELVKPMRKQAEAKLGTLEKSYREQAARSGLNEEEGGFITGAVEPYRPKARAASPAPGRLRRSVGPDGVATYTREQP